MSAGSPEPGAELAGLAEVVTDESAVRVDRTVKHRSWCVPGMCKRDPNGVGITHYSAVYGVPAESATSDTIRLQVWSPDDTHNDSEADATFFEMWIVNRRGETLNSVDLTLGQALILRTMLGIVTPEGEASTYGYRALRPGTEKMRQAADEQMHAMEATLTALVDSLHTGVQPPFPIDLTVAERHLDQAHYALDEWYSRVATPERTYVAGGHDAVAEIDAAIAALRAVRAELVDEIRGDEIVRIERADALLAESREALASEVTA